MTTTTMHFGPEWMRTKGTARPAPEPLIPAATPAGASTTYSALAAPTPNLPPQRQDVSNPFRYPKEEMLRIYKEGGGRGGLGLEVERWEGIVREVGYEPVGLKEMGESEKKLFAGPLNSEIRRRQATDVLSPLTASHGERQKLGHAATTAGSPMRDRLGNLMGRRRDSTDQQPLGLGLPRKLSLSSIQGGSLASPRDAALPSPRTRTGGTPGFEGVLGESWSSRRRGDSLSKPGAEATPRREREPAESKSPYIKEEEEDTVRKAGQNGSDGADPAAPHITTTNGVGGRNTADSVHGVSNGVAGLNLGANPDSASVEATGGLPSKPPGLTDLANIEWSYLDPQGNVQGPFQAELMQRWHNEGYFTPDLLMKRTHLDTEWTSVGEMTRRAGANPIFLTFGVTSSAPPGLSRRPDMLAEAPGFEKNTPLQPAPSVSRRSSTLDAYLHNGTSASASPSSSFGGRPLNGSPDPSSLDGRTGTSLYGEPTVGPRLATLASMPSIANQRRPAFNDAFDASTGLRASFSHPGLNRGIENQGISGLNGFGTSASPQVGPYSNDFGATGLGVFGSNPSLAALRSVQDMPLGHAAHGAAQDLGLPSTPSRIVHRDMYVKPPEDVQASPFGVAPLNGNDVPYSPSVQSSSQAQSIPYPTSQHSHVHTPLLERPPVAPVSSFGASQPYSSAFVSSPVRTAAAPQWPPQPSPAIRRAGPFDPDYPTTSNSVITGLSTVPAIPYGRSMPTRAVNGGWNTSNLTVENLGQHNQQQHEVPGQQRPSPEGNPAQPAALATVPEPVPAEPIITEPTVSAAPLASVEPSRPSQKKRKPSALQAPSPTIPKSVPVVVPAPIKPPSPAPTPASTTTPTAEPKAPWATDDDVKKAKPSAVTLGLREIQEAEMKKLEARKVAERERERAARAVGTSQSEEFQPFTASWGLPTSQAGAARTVATPKDAAAPTIPAAATAATPVWTNAAKTPVAKKTMKEIQEEEEKRKKQAAKEKETVAAAAKRGYADTTTKPTTPVAPAVGGAWTTVGSGGRAPTVVTPPAVRPAITTSASTKVIPSVASPTVASASVVVRSTVTAPSPRLATVTKATPKTDDFPTPPSQDFMKWMGESLKGLNSSINLEEITSMLLSFPLDPDPSTVEIISDLIYASSTTLDGRRFASDFVGRRKADAATRAKNGVVLGSAKAVSIADVVKAQPKPTQQSEWGGFKVVNKKKKGGRA